MQYHRQHTDYTTGYSFCSFRPLHRDPPRHQLAKQQRKIGKHDGHQHNCQHMTDRKTYAACSQPFIQPCHQSACKSVRCSCTGQKSCQRNPDLDRRQKNIRLLCKLQQTLCFPIAVLCQLPQPVFIQRYNGNLGRRQKGIDQNQNDQ